MSSSLTIGSNQILPEKTETITGYTINTTKVPVHTNNKFSCFRSGKIITFNIDWNYGTNIVTGVNSVITGLPKPANPLTINECYVWGDGNTHVRCWINGNGDMILYGYGDTTERLFGFGTYICQ